MRDAPYAKRARTVVVNNVVGSGVGLQAQVYNSRGELHERINADIEEAWREWCKADSCHTGGELHFSDLERAAMAEVFTAGEVFIRLHRRPFGNSKIPFAVELIEAERLADEFSNPYPGPTNSKADVRLGVEVDQFGRPLAYWIRERHPGELRASVDASVRLERVPASDVIHLRVIDRWPQTRGEPWLHSVITKLDNMDEYSASELTAARMSANFFATLESDNLDGLATTTDAATGAATGAREMQIEPGIIEQLTPGEKLQFHQPNRPNVALDPFLRYMLREVAAGVGVSYESISKDYSQSNYSSSRLSLLDDRDLWRVLQQAWGRSFRSRLHEQWLQAAVLSRAVPSISVEAYALRPEQFTAVTWKFRGWQWVDPTKEVSAYKEAVKAGFTTISAVIAQTGGGVDIEDVIAERKRELAMFEEAEIDVDTTVEEPQEPAEPAAVQAPQPADDAEDTAAEDKAAEDKAKEEDRQHWRNLIGRALNDAELRGEMRGRNDATAEAVSHLATAVERKQTVVNITTPDVNVAAPVVNVAPAEVTVNVPEQRSPVVNVAAAEVNVPATVVNVAPADVTVNVPPQRAPVVHVDIPKPGKPEPRAIKTTVEHDDQGRIVATRTEEL
jgi:lambda family phage portal protein